MILSKRTLKRIKNLEGICEFDIDNAISTVHLYFKNISEICDEKLSTPGNPVISEEMVKIITNNLDIVPGEFKINYLITIDDMEGYDPTVIEAAFLRTVETMDFKRGIAKKTKRSRMTAFALIGLLLIIPVVLNTKYHWLDSYGKMFSILMACLLELIFELHFEDGVIYFTVSRIYEKAGEINRNRINNIRLNPH